jgi:hypothetical protein
VFGGTPASPVAAIDPPGGNDGVASSPQYSLAEQAEPPWPECVSISGPAGAAARAWYGETGMPVFSWSSLPGGFLSGRYTRENIGTLPR